MTDMMLKLSIDTPYRIGLGPEDSGECLFEAVKKNVKCLPGVYK